LKILLILASIPALILLIGTLSSISNGLSKNESNKLASSLSTSATSPYSTGSQFDDLFGMHYDGGDVPANAQGIAISFSSSTAGVSFSSSNFVSTCLMVTLNAGSPDPYRLEPCVSLWPSSSCSSQGISTTCWAVSLGWFDSNGNGQPKNVAYLSTATYPSISGMIQGFYTASAWTDEIVIYQTAASPYTFKPPVSGTYVDGSNNDWSSVETGSGQTGITFSSGE
jgi:hypothetical protein